jgi:hypothetical protein
MNSYLTSMNCLSSVLLFRYHGFSVMHFAYWMLRHTYAGEFLPKSEQLALLIAALSHDVDHPGTTNGFQIACDSSVARAHNDQSVLEHHHAFVTFELLRDPRMDIFQQDPPEEDNNQTGPDTSTGGVRSRDSSVGATVSSSSNTNSPNDGETGALSSNPVTPPSPVTAKWSAAHFRSFRKTVISAILSTDMSKHFALCKQLDSQLPDCLSLDAGKEEDRQFMIDLLTHSSDLSAQVLPFEFAFAWERRITQEFSEQAQLEAELGLPVSAFMQNLDDPTVRFKNHLNYIDYIASPLWMGVAELLPPLGVCVRNLLDNRKKFMRFLPQEEVQLALAAEELETENASAAVKSTGDGVNSTSVTEPSSPIGSPRIGDIGGDGSHSKRASLDRASSASLPTPALNVGVLRAQRGSIPGAMDSPTMSMRILPTLRSKSFSNTIGLPLRPGESMDDFIPTGNTQMIGGADGFHSLNFLGAGLGFAPTITPPSPLNALQLQHHQQQQQRTSCTHGPDGAPAIGVCTQCNNVIDESALSAGTSGSNTPTPTTIAARQNSGGNNSGTSGSGYHTPTSIGHRRKMSAPIALLANQLSLSQGSSPMGPSAFPHTFMQSVLLTVPLATASSANSTDAPGEHQPHSAGSSGSGGSHISTSHRGSPHRHLRHASAGVSGMSGCSSGSGGIDGLSPHHLRPYGSNSGSGSGSSGIGGGSSPSPEFAAPMTGGLLNIKERKAQRWLELTGAPTSHEPVRALPLHSSPSTSASSLLINSGSVTNNNTIPMSANTQSQSHQYQQPPHLHATLSRSHTPED